MKRRNSPKPTKHYTTTLHQLCKLIPVGMVRNLAKQYKVDKKSRAFSPWSHVVALFWKVLNHLQNQFPGFGPSGRYKGLLRRFKKTIHSIDSSTIALVANCMNWAKHRRRKAAAKLHLHLNLQTFLPGFAVIEEACHHDNSRMGALCAGLQEGEIAVFDKAYVHFKHLYSLTQQGVYTGR